MKSTRQVAASIQAVFAPSIFGGSAASAKGACTRKIANRTTRCGRERSLIIDILRCACYRCGLRTGTKHTSTRRNVVGVKVEPAGRAIGEPVLQGERDGAEGELLPGHRALVEKGHLERFLARRHLEREQAGAEEHVHLIDARHGDHAEGG